MFSEEQKMSLRAIIDGKDVIASFLDDEAWKELRAHIKQENIDVQMPCCGNPAYLRKSKHGFHHFIHRERGDCTSKPEIWQHLKAKQDIARACHAAGYNTKTEVIGDGWSTDVLATKGNIKLAFGVQWTRQTWETTQERQQRCKEAGIRGCWLFKTLPSQHHATREVPLFKLDVTETACTVVFNPYSYAYWESHYDRPIPLADFVTALLTGQIKFCETVRSQRRQKVGIVFVEIGCWKCHKPHHIYYMHDLTTGCGDSIEVSGAAWGNEKYYFNPQIIALVREFVRSPEGQHLRIGAIKRRYSKTVERAYLSFGCPHCDAIVGDFFLHEIIAEAFYHEDKAPAILEKELTLSEIITVPHPHWCFPENGQFCCG
jgi:hypothetical protein